MVSAHQYLPPDRGSGDELAKILEKRKAITEGKKGNFSGGNNTVKPNRTGLSGGIRAKGAGRKVRRLMKDVSDDIGSKGKRKLQDNHEVSVPKQKSKKQKTEMLLGISKMPAFFNKKSIATRIIDSPPPSPRQRAVSEQPMGSASAETGKASEVIEEPIEEPSFESKKLTRKERKQNRLIEKFDIGDPKTLRRELDEVDIDRRANLESSLVTMNTKIFSGGVGSEKVKDMDEIQAGLELQTRNVKLAIVKGILSGNVKGKKSDRKNMAMLVATFDELAKIGETLLPRESFSQLNENEKKEYIGRLTALMDLAEHVEGKISEPMELKIAAVTTKSSCMKLINTMADTMENPQDYKIVPKRAW